VVQANVLLPGRSTLSDHPTQHTRETIMNLSLVTRTMPSTFTAAVAGGVLLLSPLAEAGKAVVTAEGGSQAIFEYRDDMLRIGNDQNNSYMVMREGTMYVVSLEGEQPMVFNASSMIKGMAQNTLQVAPSTLTSEFVSIKDTGRDETVAGIKGDVYEVTIREDGKERTDEIVLSKDKRAREFRDALFAMSTVAEDIAGKEAVEQGRDMQEKLMDMNVGVLRYADQMQVSSITGDKIDSSRFELPAEPMDMQDLGAMMGAAMQQAQEAQQAEGGAADGASQESGGLFSSMMGALGGKADRQADRVGDSVDNEVDNQTDKAVDNAIGKAFGKLFGDR
jgi:hypothetical protein